MRFYHIYSKFSSKINEIRYKYLWQYGLWIFQTEVTKLERFLPKNQYTLRKYWILRIENWVNGEVSNSAKISLSKSIFYVKNYPNLFQLTQFSKFNNLLLCWFLGKNISNFVNPFENSTTRIAISITFIRDNIFFQKFIQSSFFKGSSCYWK